jgi:hypothetical protein
MERDDLQAVVEAAAGKARKRSLHDFYGTPSWVTRGILPHLPLGGRVLEPAAGEGAMVRELLRAGVGASQITALEIDPARAENCPVEAKVCDYLTEEVGAYDLIITNPPYLRAQAFVERSLDIAGERGTVAMLLRLGFLESVQRRELHEARPADLYVLSQRPSFTGDGRVDATAYAWFVWGPGRGGRWSLLAGEKPRRQRGSTP